MKVQVGDVLPPLVKAPIERIQLVKYAGASGDFNRIHVEEGFAVEAGYPSVIAHGMLSMGFLGQLVAAWVGPTRVRRITARFRAVTFPGDTVTCRGEVVAVREGEVDLRLWTTRQDGTVTIEGTATVELP
jgi:acyl dehydratase